MNMNMNELVAKQLEQCVIKSAEILDAMIMKAVAEAFLASIDKVKAAVSELLAPAVPQDKEASEEEAEEDEQCTICREGMQYQQGLFTLGRCGHAYHTPCFLQYVTMETDARKPLRCCNCKMGIGEDAEI